MQKYSPFYLKHHPEARKQGDITHIQQLSEQKSKDGDELAGIEQVFEKNGEKFNNLISQGDAAKQLEGVKATVKNSMQRKQQKKDRIALMINADELEDEEAPAQTQNVQTEESSDDDEAPPQNKNVELSEDYDQFNHHEYSLIDQNNHSHNIFFEPKQSGDYSLAAANSKPERKMMGKIAQLETQVFAMQKKIKQLEIEKEKDEKEIEKLVLF